jgi:hypothetical protein
MNRRAFFAALAAAAATAAYDPERALWVPGRKTYFPLLGRALPGRMFEVGDKVKLAGFPEVYEVVSVNLPGDYILASLRLLPPVKRQLRGGAAIRTIPSPPCGQSQVYAVVNGLVSFPEPEALIITETLPRARSLSWRCG